MPFAEFGFHTGESRMAQAIRAYDWQASALGAPETWPKALGVTLSIMLTSEFPMFTIWGNEHICFYNDGYIPMLAARHPQSLGLPFCQVWPEIWDDLLPLIDSAYAGRAIMKHDMALMMLRKGTLEQAFFTFSYSPIYTAVGEVGGMFCVCTETTAEVTAEIGRKAALAALQQLNASLDDKVLERTRELEATHEQLRQSQKLEVIGKLTGGIAHDFNNVLQVISGNLQLLRNVTRDNVAAHGRVNAAMAGVDRGAKLASQLLSFARKQPLEPIVLNIGRLLANMDGMLRSSLGELIWLETIVASDLWNTHVDANRLENAILNLAVNARDAMDGQGSLTIEASNAAIDDTYAHGNADVLAGEYVMIAVSDTGTGMNAAVQEQAFDPFFTTKPAGHGTGLGLAMVHGFVRQSGGHVKLYSELGHGTTIKIYLPRSRSAEQAIAPILSGPIVGGSETILVVEDDTQVRDTVVALLADLKYRVLKAPDAMSALAILESGIEIAMLFTDVVMPGPMHSTEMARRAQALHPDIVVLYTSGYTENAIVHHGRLDEGVSLLSKPYRREDLARKVRHMLNNGAHEAGLKQGRALAPPVVMVSAPAPLAAVATPAGLTVLLVEDGDDARELTTELLHSLGHHVESVNTAEAALQRLGQASFDVLMTDVTLPGMSGLQLAEAASSLKQMAIVFASGHPPSEYAPEQSFWLQKPFSLNEIVAVLRVIAARLAAGGK